MAEAHKQLLVDKFLCSHQVRRANEETLTVITHVKDKKQTMGRATVRSGENKVRKLTKRGDKRRIRRGCPII